MYLHSEGCIVVNVMAEFAQYLAFSAILTVLEQSLDSHYWNSIKNSLQFV